MFSKNSTKKSMRSCSDSVEQLRRIIRETDSILIGAGAGLSTADGFTYSGERFDRYFSDFKEKYGFSDMYSGGFYPFPRKEIFWAYWSRYIWINRYQKTPFPVYEQLHSLIKEKDCFVLTTNVDHCFQKAGFDKARLFYTQGDYGLFQCSMPCSQKTYDNEIIVKEMLKAQGYIIGKDGNLLTPKDKALKMEVPTELLPRCPHCGKPLTTNLRCDGTFVEDRGWHQAAKNFNEYLYTHKKKRILYLELGVGYNTPGIIKYPFWKMTAENTKAIYATVNKGEAFCPSEIGKQSICIDGDIKEVIRELTEQE